MKKPLVLVAALGALALSVPTVGNAAPASPFAFKAGDGANLVQQIRRVRVCEFRHGKRHCWWKVEKRHKKRWYWRKNRHGVRVRIYL